MSISTKFHPKPDGYEVHEWFQEMRKLYGPEATLLAAVEFIYDQPDNPMYRKVIGRVWGIDVEIENG